MKKWLAWVWVPFVLCTIYRRWPFPELSLIMKFGRMMVSTISALVPEGRPRLLDETAELNLIDTIERRHLANDAVRTSDFMAVYASAATEYYARLGVGKTVFTVSKRTLRNIKLKHSVSDNMGWPDKNWSANKEWQWPKKHVIHDGCVSCLLQRFASYRDIQLGCNTTQHNMKWTEMVLSNWLIPILKN